MPWIVPSHQAPALLLKRWRPRWFSGLGLALGSLAPDLEFIVPLKRETTISHTLLGQVAFTLPVAIGLYLLTCELVWPWLLPNLPRSWQDRIAVRRPRGWGWWQVGVSILLGGVTHVAIDGFTHPVSDHGWAVAFLPLLSWSVPFPLASVPVYAVLQETLSLGLGLTAWRTWSVMIREGSRSEMRSEPQFMTADPAGRFLPHWLMACAGLGALAAFLLRHEVLSEALKFAAYGALDGIALGMLLPAVVARMRRSLSRKYVSAAMPIG